MESTELATEEHGEPAGGMPASVERVAGVRSPTGRPRGVGQRLTQSERVTEEGQKIDGPVGEAGGDAEQRAQLARIIAGGLRRRAERLRPAPECREEPLVSGLPGRRPRARRGHGSRRDIRPQRQLNNCLYRVVVGGIMESFVTWHGRLGVRRS
jgi:hypothetical protein